jgi:hypothetical protein
MILREEVMSKKIVCAVIALFALVAGAAFAQSSFQNTCSNIAFAYSGKQAALSATCLRADGSPNASTLILQGIGNQNGKLVQGSGASTFQQSCGNIQITVSGSQVTLSALCRTSSGASNATTLPLNGIENNGGNLSY